MYEEHLYRGKRLDKDAWAYGFLSRMSKEASVIREIDEQEHTIPIVVDTATVGRCSGLRAIASRRGSEKDDLLLWQGDMVSVRQDEKHEQDEKIGTVEFDCGAFRLLGLPISEFMDKNTPSDGSSFVNVEIVGARHDG